MTSMGERPHDQRPEPRASVRRFRLMFMVVEPVIDRGVPTDAGRPGAPAPEGRDARAQRRPKT